MLRLLLAASFALAGLAFLPPADAAACSTDLDPTDDDGVGAACRVAGTGHTCSAGALAYGDPRPRVSCDPPLIVCVREPCP